MTCFDLRVRWQDRTVFQRDQATPADPGVLGHESERWEGSTLERGLGFLARGGCHKMPSHRMVAHHNRTDYERVDFRENPTG